MLRTKKLLLWPVTILLGTALVFGGCAAAKKPMPDQQTPATPNNMVTNDNANKNYPMDVVDKAVKEANKVEGVKGSTAVIAGRNLYLGLDLNANLEKNGSAQVEENVKSRVKSIFPNYTVMVTSDIDTVTRIKRVGQGIEQGKPLSSFAEEIEEIANRLSPRTQ